MAKGNNLVGLAKGNKKPEKKVVTTPEVKIVEKPKTPEEERDLKAKQKVEELLQGVEYSPKKDNLVTPSDIASNGPSKTVAVEWLEEQVTLQSDEVETLRTELAQAKDDYARLHKAFQNKSGGGGEGSNDLVTETYKQNILLIFNELQNNLIGNNVEKVRWETVQVRHILNQLLQLFPNVVERYRRF